MSTSSPAPGSAPEPVPAEQPGSAPEPQNGQRAATRPAPAPDDAPVARVADVADRSRVRRAPRYGRFGLVGFLVGAVLSLALTFVPDAFEISRGALFLILLLGLGTAGVFAGLAWALVADRRSLRRRDG